MVKFNESDGVWRTIGGRRVFIRDGQSLSNAMKESGKFKSAKKKQAEKDDSKQIEKEELEHNKRMLKEMERRLAKKDLTEEQKDELERRTAHYESEIDEAESKEKTTKSGERDKKDYKQIEKQLLEDYTKVDTEDLEYYHKIFKEQGKEKFAERIEKELVVRSSKGAWKEIEADNVKRQTEAIEKASGLKVKEAFETDLYGNGKEDRFMLDDDRWVSHTKEALGSKQDTWSINELKNGSIESKDFKSYDDMIKHLSSNNKSIKQLNEEMLGNKYEGKGQTPNLIYSNNRRIDIDNQGHATVWRDGKIERKTNLPDNVKGDKTKQYFDDYLKKLDNNRSNNTAYKKAFEEYKKKHPNSKLNLQKFIDMSEGK